MLSTLKTSLLNVLRDEEGASLVEYVLLVALIAVVCIAAVTLLGTSAKDKFNTTATEIGKNR
jgi:pilus assembly protein Flp/PilA